MYLLRRVLYGYGDDEGVEILDKIREAMDRDNSTLLIIDMILLPDSPPLCFAIDMNTMGIAGNERTREDWETLSSRAGLKITKVVWGEGIGLSVLECNCV